MKNISFRLPSFAKINWNLKVLGKRPDGYHQVSTVLQTVSLHDELVFASAKKQIHVSCDDPAIPTDATNLIWRAAEALRNRTGYSGGADIFLSKRIPAQGGLGGASSNAAITLMGLNHLWHCGLDRKELLVIGSRIGADVPFFLFGGTARAKGTGTRVSQLEDTIKTYLIIVSPNASVSTAAAYAALDARSLTTSKSTSILARSFAGPDFGECIQWPLRNDFEDVIFEIEPEIKRAKEALLASGARCALLAGSGSSVFGIFTDEEAREEGLGAIKRESGWRVFSCSTVLRNEYLAAIDPAALTLF